MASFLDRMAGDLYAGFRGKLQKGLIRRKFVNPEQGLDELGDQVAPVPVDKPCEGFTQDYNDAFRVAAGIPTSDLKVCLFGASIKGWEPQKDDRVRLTIRKIDRWFQLRGPIKTDPAGALFTCQAYPIPDPGDA